LTVKNGGIELACPAPLASLAKKLIKPERKLGPTIFLGGRIRFDFTLDLDGRHFASAQALQQAFADFGAGRHQDMPGGIKDSPGQTQTDNDFGQGQQYPNFHFMLLRAAADCFGQVDRCR
jgi:hypothetical protein